MITNTITAENLSAYREYLKSEEKASVTVEKYGRDVKTFAAWLGGAEATKQSALDYKQYLLEEQCREAAGVNAAIAGLNSFFSFMEWGIKLKPLKIQRQTFRAADKELTKAEYMRLLAAAILHRAAYGIRSMTTTP